MNGRRKFLKGAALLSVLPTVSLEAFASSSSDSLGANETSFRVMTCNIRVDLPVDDEKKLGWRDRKDICIDIIKKYKPDIVGFQEVFNRQNTDLRKEFRDYYFLGYDGPEMNGVTEYAGIAKNPLLIRKSRFELLSVGSYWLSETPNIPGSESWGTYRARHVNHAILRDLVTGKDFRFLNTHLTTKPNETKIKQLEMIAEDAKRYKEDFPQILTGDFNAAPDSAPMKFILSNNFVDTYLATNTSEFPGATGHGFLGDTYEAVKKKAGNRIDYILAKGAVKAKKSVVITDKKNGIYPSDHYFMYADVEI